jgi:hypothetical protein
MSSQVATILADLFAPGAAPGSPVTLTWFLLKRHGQPLLLLPRSRREARQGMELYAAQRPLAKLVRRLLPIALQPPLNRCFPGIRTQTNSSSELLRFLATEVGGPPGQLPAPAILLGNQPADQQRFVILVINVQARPVAVVKCGLTPSARRVVEQEAAVLAALPAGLPGGLNLGRQLITPTLSAFSAPYCPGQHPHNADRLGETLGGWLRPGPLVPLHSLPVWQLLDATCGTEKLFHALHQAVGHQHVRPAIHHGDFTPWNIRVNPAGHWTAVDWERGDRHGMPGWDWFHYVIQTAILVERISGAALVARIETMLQEADFQNYAKAANISTICRPLLLAYLLHQNQIIKPGESREVCQAAQEELAVRWTIAH